MIYLLLLVSVITLFTLGILFWVFFLRQHLSRRHTQAQAQMQALLQDLRIGVIVVDAQFNISLQNQTALDMLGITQADLQDKTSAAEWSARFEDGACFTGSLNALLRAIAAAQTPEASIVVGIESSQLVEPMWLLANAVPQTKRDGHLERIIYTFNDITERKRTEITLRQQVERERLVATIAQRIRQSLDLNQILNTTVAEVRQQFQTDRVVVCRAYPTGDLEVVAESIGQNLKPVVGATIPQIVPPERQEFYRQGYSHAFDDIEQVDYPPLMRLLRQQRITSFVVVPILQDDTLWGLLIAHACDRPRHWSEADIEFLSQLATQVSIAIRQSQLYQQVQQFNVQLESQVAERTMQLEQSLEFEATLKRITDKVRDSLDEAQILQTAVQELGLVLEANSCNAALYDLDREVSAVFYEYTISSVAYRGRVMQMANRPELYRQLRRGYYFQFCSLSPNSPRGQAVMLACPIVENEGVIGDLWVVDEQGDGFEETQIRLVQQVANQCAIAIRQARLYQASRTQVEELERLNRLKDDFLSTVSHELRTPMANMKMAIHMLKSIPSGERRQRYLEILEAECTREVELINDLLDLQRLEASSYATTIDIIQLQTWLPAIVEPFYSRVLEYQQILQVNYPQGLPPLTSDAMALRRILVELLNNACKYTHAGGKIILTVSTTPDAGNPLSPVILTVRNQAEIPANELAYLFEKFYRVPNGDPWSRGGTGLGLALVKKLVEHLHGTIEVQSSNGWTTFTVKLPITIPGLDSLPSEQTKV